MNVGDNIKRIRLAKSLSQKEITIASKLDTAQYSRIETNKTDPSVSTLEKIAQAMGVTLADLFSTNTILSDENSLDKSILEKVSLVESLSDEEKNTIYIMLDAFVGKRKLKSALQNVLQETV
jgi:transcriptional regulator with XRE-family HTH domain